MIPDSSHIAQQKAQLRLEMKARRRQMSESEREKESLQTCANLWHFFAQRRDEMVFHPIAVYLSRPDELSLDPLILRLLEAKFTLCAPRLDLEKDAMDFRQLNSLDAVSSGPWKIREPVSHSRIVPQIVLLPGLGFDANGHRLGMGGGWYDKTLTGWEVVKIGVCFQNQLVSHIPSEVHDLTMDYVACGEQFLVVG